MLKLTDELSEKSKTILGAGKQRFSEARVLAIKAFGNEALKTTDRVLAMKIRIMATISSEGCRKSLHDCFSLIVS